MVKLYLTKSKKGQTWYIDFIIGSIVFLIVAILFFNQLSSIENSESSQLRPLVDQASLVSTSLLTPGYPQNWDETNLLSIGVVDNVRINQTKWLALSQMNYKNVRSLFRIEDQFFFFLENKTNCVVDINGIKGIGHDLVIVPNVSCAAKKSINLDLANVTNLVQITRLTIHNGEPTKLVTYIWE